jgi:hypothetical protein
MRQKCPRRSGNPAHEVTEDDNPAPRFPKWGAFLWPNMTKKYYPQKAQGKIQYILHMTEHAKEKRKKGTNTSGEIIIHRGEAIRGNGICQGA